MAHKIDTMQQPIIVNTKAFTTELEWCARFIERKTTIPILSNVLLSNRNGELSLTSTDLEIGGITSIEADGPDFDLTVPAALLLKYLKKVDDSKLRLIPELKRYEPQYGPHVKGCGANGTEGCCELPSVRSCALTVEHGTEDASVTVEGMARDSYPELPSRPLDCFEIGGFEDAIPRALVSITTVGSRFTLNGALLVADQGKASLISTDGHRLSVADLKSHDPVNKFKALIPRKALAELARLGDSAYISRDEHHVFFRVGDHTILSRVLTGNFPDYERVIPKSFKYTVSVSNAPLRKVIDRVSVFADERSRAVKVTVSGSLSVAANSMDSGKASGQVPFDGPDFACPYGAGFSATYLQDFLKSADPTVYFSFSKSADATAWSMTGWQYVLMPMRMDDMMDPYSVGECEPVPGSDGWIETPVPEAPALPEPSASSSDTSKSSEMINAMTLARLMNINLATIYNHVKQGKIPPPIAGSRPMTWPAASISSLVAA